MQPSRSIAPAQRPRPDAATGASAPAPPPNSAAATALVPPPTKAMLTSAWDVDRFIVLASVEKLVGVMFCPLFEQCRTGVRPGAAASGGTSGAARTQQQYLIEAATMANNIERIAVRVSRYCTFYFADTSVMTEFDAMYELHAEEPLALLFFYRGKHVKLDVGTGNYNKINFPLDEDELLSVVEAAFVGAKKGQIVVDAGRKFEQFAGRGV